MHSQIISVIENPQPGSRVALTCPNCGKFFHRVASRYRSDRAYYCSRDCGYQFNRSPEQFWLRFNKTETCWFWTGGTSSNGYGEVVVNYHHWGTHVYAWYLTHGDIPKGMFVCHSCDVNYPVSDITYRLCGNPDHLELGTRQDNTDHMVSEGRNIRGSRHPMSKLNDTDVISIRTRHKNHDRSESTVAELFVLLAEQYKVSPKAIEQAAYYQRWRHV